MTMKLLKSKNGIIAYEAVMTIIRTLMLVFTLISLVLVANVFITRNVDTRFAESYSVMNVFYYSDNGLAHKDQATGRVYPGSIDNSQPSNIESFSYSEDSLGPFLAAKATVAEGGAAFYYKRELYDDWNFLYLAGLTKGVGGINKVSYQKTMPVYNGNNVQSSDIKVEVVSRNV